MKIVACPLLVCLALPFTLFAQNTPIWEKQVYGNNSISTHTVAMQPTADNGLVIAATTNITSKTGNSDVLISKINAVGDIEWQKTLGGTGTDYAGAINQTTDGGFIVAASTLSADGNVTANHGGFDVWLVKLTTAGNIEWQKSYGGSSDDIANSILPTKDNGYIFTASTRSTDGDAGGSHSPECYWCVKTDSQGNIQWKKYFAASAFTRSNILAGNGYGGDPNPSLSFNYLNGSILRATADNGYIIAGQSEKNAVGGHGAIDYHVIKIDNGGNTEWEKLYGNDTDNIVTDIKPVSNGQGYILVGSVATNITVQKGFPTTAIHELPYYVRIDHNGDVLWEKVDTLEPSSYNLLHAFSASASSVTLAEDGDFVIGGCMRTSAFEINDGYGWLKRLDSLGNKKGFIYTASILQLATLSANEFIAAGDRIYYGSEPESTYVADMYYAKYAAAALPVRITSFTAAKNNNNNNVLVQWQTAGELNTSHFNVQRSTNAVNFTTIGTVAAAGNSTVTRDYTYTDAVTKTGGSFASALYYRLQEVDKDGTITLSKTAKVNPDEVKIQVAVTPNPAANRLMVQVQNYTGKTAFTIYNMAGQAVKQVAANVANNSQVTINITSLPAGNYVVSTVVNGIKVNQRFVKQ